MSEMVDDDLLGGDESDDIYDITNEREEALLQDDEDYSKGRDLYDSRKKEAYSDMEEPDDVLNLDIEEDFQDEDKNLYEEEEEEESCKKDDRKFSVENKQSVLKQNVTTVAKVPVIIKSAPAAQKNNSAPQKIVNIKKTFVRNDKWKRGNEKGHFQPRPRFVKNNMQRRRNGTVLINPRYEGTVHLNENNARLAWDNNHAQYPQNNTNMIRPWGPGNVFGNNDANSLLVTNLVTGIASLTQQPANMLLSQTQTPLQTFYQQPRNNYEPPLAFEPPPNVTQSRPPQQSYNNQNSVTNQMHPLPQQSYYREPQQHFNNQMPTNRLQGNSYTNYGSYNRPITQQNYPPEPQKNLNRTNSYENKNLNYNRPMNKFTAYNNNTFPTQNNFQNKNVGYGNNNYQNRKPNYTGNGLKQINCDNYTPATYEDKNWNKTNFNQRNENMTIQQQVNNNVPNKNFIKPGNRRPVTNDTSDTHDESKKIKSDNGELQNEQKKEKVNDQIKRDNESQNVKDKQKIQQTNAPEEHEDEDEETRLYRLKIEEQKRERERILRIKEERRKQMILQQQKQEQDKLAIPESGAPSKPPPQFTKKINFERPVGAVSVQKPNQLGAVQRSNQLYPAIFERQIQVPTFSSTPLQQTQYSNNSSDPSTELSNLTFKVTNNLQSSAPVVKDPPKTEASSSSFMSNRTVVVKSKNNQKSVTLANPTLSQPVITESSNKSSDVSSFFNNRKVLKKDNNLLNTKLVVVNNLSATINQNKLVALSRGIGEIQTLRVDTQERQATILFKSVASAHAFFKKYQRRILDDLSMIEVKLEPML